MLRGYDPLRPRDYIFGPRRDARGGTLSFTRFDIFLAVVLGFALLAAISYSAEPLNGWTKLRVAIVLGVFVAVGLVAQNRLVVFGCSMGIVTMRLALGVLLGHHPLQFLLAALVCAFITWLMLKDI